MNLSAGACMTVTLTDTLLLLSCITVTLLYYSYVTVTCCITVTLLLHYSYSPVGAQELPAEELRDEVVDFMLGAKPDQRCVPCVTGM